MSEYEGPECQQKHVINNHKPTMTFKKPKENYSIRFHNSDNEEVGVMDFNGSGLMYEGNAEQGAIVFMDWVSKTFMGRLKEEYDRGFEAGKAAK
jgi:hypothetical protein